MSGLPQKDSDRPTEAALLRVLEEVAEVRGLWGSDSDRPKEAALPRVLEEEQLFWKSPQYGAFVVSEPGWRARVL